LRVQDGQDDRPVWTASCPCQPFSQAAKENNLMMSGTYGPPFIGFGQQRPVVIFGEQSSSKDAEVWIDLVQTDMESLGYAFGASAFPSAGVGAPHIRAYWLADSNREQYEERLSGCREGDRRKLAGRQSNLQDFACLAGWPTCGEGWKGRVSGGRMRHGKLSTDTLDVTAQIAGPARLTDSGDLLTGSFADGKWRPVKPGLKPLVNGVPSRVGKLRASGNAVNIMQQQLS
jgi:DNA (cytosine-5)-methyltransferase 1